MKVWRVAKWLVLPLLVAILYLFAARLSFFDEPATAPIALKAMPERLAGSSYAKSLAEADGLVRQRQDRTKLLPDDWLNWEDLAIALLSRTQLTGNYDDFTSAQAALDAGFAKAVTGSGPHLVAASLALSTHRLDDVRRHLDAVDRFVVPDKPTVSEAKAMRGDLALFAGRYDEAAKLYAETRAIDMWPGLLYRQGTLAFLQGRFDTAKSFYAAADNGNPLPSATFRAGTLLRLGEIAFAQGNWAEATRLYGQAEHEFAGSPRVAMRMAQMQALNGDVPGAIRRFESLANQTNWPEAMDKAAGLYRATGNADASRAWSAKASSLWEARMAMLPATTRGHMVEHLLAFGDPKRALRLAGEDVQARPYGATQIMLAKAWLANGRPDHALALCDKALAQGWGGADVWVTKARALSELGRQDEAEEAREAALAINPKAFDKSPAYAWLDH